MTSKMVNMLPKVKKWERSPKYPLTEVLWNLFRTKPGGKHITRTHIVSEKLCDDMLKRLSPYLEKNRPTDILDIFPSNGLWSSKVNDFLNPRQHVLLDSHLHVYGDMLEELAATKPSYKLVQVPRDWDKRDNGWDELFDKHVPEPPDNGADGVINNSLLVLANLTYQEPKSSHFTPSREWAYFLSKALWRMQFNRYGMVRILALMPAEEGYLTIPRTVFERKRPALLTEALGKRAFNVADSTHYGHWTALKTWDMIQNSATRAAERAADQELAVIEGREQPPIPMAPESSYAGRMPMPYVPRARHEWQQEYIDHLDLVKKHEAELEASPSAGKKEAEISRLRKRLSRLQIQLNQDNRRWNFRQELCDNQAEIDRLERLLCRAAVDPNADSKSLKDLDSKIAAMRSEVAEKHSQKEYVVQDRADLHTDDRRAALRTGSLDDAVLFWDRRPFEPLKIEYDELYPLNNPCHMIYFEPNADSPVVQALEAMEWTQKHDTMALFEGIVPIVGSRGSISISEFLTALFPGRPANDIVKAVPSLAAFASRSLKPDSEDSAKASDGPMPLSTSTTTHQKEDEGEIIDPVYTFQENINYDFSGVRLRSLPIFVIWDIIFEYSKWPAKADSTRRLNNILGGSMTDYQSAIFSFVYKAGSSTGKVHKL